MGETPISRKRCLARNDERNKPVNYNEFIPPGK
jgi:hypothetical protein